MLRTLRWKLVQLGWFFKWLPHVFKDKHWDMGYMYGLMLAKIRFVRQEIERSQRHLYWERDVKRMRVCEEMLRRLVEDDFRCGCDGCKPYWDSLKSYDLMDLSDIKQRAKKNALHDKYKKNACKEVLFTTLSKYMDGWWD